MPQAELCLAEMIFVFDNACSLSGAVIPAHWRGMKLSWDRTEFAAGSFAYIIKRFGRRALAAHTAPGSIS